MKKRPLLTATTISLVEDFIAAYEAAMDEALSTGLITNATSLARARKEAIAAVASDEKFRHAWADPEFQVACSTALQSRSKEVTHLVDLQARLQRYTEMIKARLPEGERWQEFFTDSDLEAIGAECGLSDEDVEQFVRKLKTKLNN